MSIKYPKDEIVWVSYYNEAKNLRFIITSKPSRDYYFLYELVNEKFQKLGKSKFPKGLEERFDVATKLKGCT